MEIINADKGKKKSGSKEEKASAAAPPPPPAAVATVHLENPKGRRFLRK
jgi:hypothetical protein